mgnify:CR=1 FL=1
MFSSLFNLLVILLKNAHLKVSAEKLKCPDACGAVTDENGKVVVGGDGKPIIKIDEDGNKIQAKNEDGTPKYEILLDENGHKVIATDADGNKIILKDEEGNLLDATTSISDLSVEISGLQYSSISIPMSKQPGEKMYISRTDPQSIKGETIQFDIQDVDLKIPAFNDPEYDDNGNITNNIEKLDILINKYKEAYDEALSEDGLISKTEQEILDAIEQDINELENYIEAYCEAVEKMEDIENERSEISESGYVDME